MKRKSRPISMRVGQLEFLQVNTGGQEWRDVYHWVLSLTWPRFALLILGVYLVLNLIFAILYAIGGPCIAEMVPGSFLGAFFFSAETLATVGYGHMFPQTLYGHIVATIEIIIGMFWLAVMTGLIFVRFSRPTARILFSDSLVVAPFDGKPTLMLRVANLRHHSMVEAEFRLMLHRDEPVAENEIVRRFYTLKLHFDRLIMFPAVLTLRHTIDEESPLHGVSAAELERSETRLMASVVCIETVIPAAVQSQYGYSWREVRFGERFVEVYTELGENRLSVDYSRIHETEPMPEPGAKAEGTVARASGRRI
ncbi:MAG: ion channel [Spartobacteria bacterium]